MRIRAAEYLHCKSSDHKRDRQISGICMQGGNQYLNVVMVLFISWIHIIFLLLPRDKTFCIHHRKISIYLERQGSKFADTQIVYFTLKLRFFCEEKFL